MEVEKEQMRRWEIVHKKLHDIGSDSMKRKNWGKEVTQRKDDMLFNCDYLVDRSHVEAFLACIGEYERSYKDLGWNFQVTGPWPPYHFSKMSKEK
ncbi:GvpL/GvpF family gas vesicle protein [Ammoniphilus sp. 3BR4]|uniref:GvpL/GvpF family gas vesicle protein n=1 Tax=Ammoniphilus sp. 3BR4 TaxID=3158265 RepID=UPI003467568A